MRRRVFGEDGTQGKVCVLSSLVCTTDPICFEVVLTSSLVSFALQDITNTLEGGQHSTNPCGLSFVSSIPWVGSEGLGVNREGQGEGDKQTISRKEKETDERTGRRSGRSEGEQRGCVGCRKRDDVEEEGIEINSRLGVRKRSPQDLHLKQQQQEGKDKSWWTLGWCGSRVLGVLLSSSFKGSSLGLCRSLQTDRPAVGEEVNISEVDS